MILDLREFQEFPAQSTLRAEPGEFKPFADDVKAVGEVRLNLTIQRSDDEFYCQAEVSAEYIVECSRCLADYTQHVVQPTDFILRGDEPSTARRADLVEDDEYLLALGNDYRADVTEPIRQALILSLPMKPLCSDDCRGLCPHCGVNLNEGACRCRVENIDPRWEGLRDLTGQGRRE